MVGSGHNTGKVSPMQSAPRPALLLLDDELRVTWADPVGCRCRGMEPDALHGAALVEVLRRAGAHERFALERDAASEGGGYRLVPIEAGEGPAAPESAAPPHAPGGEDGHARLAHDLRTPLNAMAGWLHLLGAPREIAPEMRERALAGLRAAIEQQLRLVATLDEPPVSLPPAPSSGR